VVQLYRRGDLTPICPQCAVGYRQLWQHLAGLVSLDEAIKLAVLATRHLARRQLIWMRAETELSWFDSESDDFKAKWMRV